MGDLAAQAAEARRQEAIPDLSNPDLVLSQKQVCDLTGLKRNTIWKLRRDGTFPNPHKLTTRKIGWPARVISDWLMARAGEVA